METSLLLIILTVSLTCFLFVSYLVLQEWALSPEALSFICMAPNWHGSRDLRSWQRDKGTCQVEKHIPVTGGGALWGQGIKRYLCDRNTI